MVQKRDQFGRKITPGLAQPPPAETGPKAGPPVPKAGQAARQPPAPTIRVTPSPTPQRQPSRHLGTVALVAALGGLALAAFWFGTHGQDRYFIDAEKMVTDYEMGRPKAARNYGHSVYGNALGLLAKVDPGSASGPPARSLKARLEQDIREFETRQQAKQDVRSATLKKKKARDEAYMSARYRAVVNPVTEYPECEHEEASQRNHNHD